MQVNYNGMPIPITNVTAFTSSEWRGFGSAHATEETTYYKYPGVKIKLKKNTQLDFKYGKSEGSTKIKTRPAIGILILEGVLTLGIGTGIDLITGAYWVTENRFIDVPAVLDKKTPRNRRTLMRKVASDF